MQNMLRLILILALLGLLGYEVKNWDDLDRMGRSYLGSSLSFVFPILMVIITIVAGFIGNAIINAIFAPRYKPHLKVSPEERRHQAEREAKAAIRQGRNGMALMIYEEAGMYSNALEIAQETSDVPAQARISVRLGHYSRARRLFIQCDDLHMAGNVSLLMNEIQEARNYYGQAAAKLKKSSGDTAEVAMLYDRAGEYETAAGLYEQASKLADAAECMELTGQLQKAEKIYDQARAMEIFERKQASDAIGEYERRKEDNKITAGKMAEQAANRGDLLLAAFNYRKAGKLMEAATTFERIEEWRRAAKAYDELGLEDRAEMARMRAPEIEVEEPNSGFNSDAVSNSRSNLMPPPPADQSSYEFQPLQQPAPMPVYAALGMQAPTSADPNAQEDMLQLVRHGKFGEAAQRAADANNWPMAAAFYECAGDLAKAADTYRRIGRNDEAVQCLNRAGKPEEAAMLSIAEGREDRAVEALIGSLENENLSPEEKPLPMLLELLVDWGMIKEGRELLEKRLAPLNRLQPGTAKHYYLFGILLEKAGYVSEALEIFKEIQEAGAVSENVKNKIQELQEKLESDEEGIAKDRKEPQLDHQRQEAVQKVLTNIINESPEVEDDLEEGATKTFTFEPSEYGDTNPMQEDGVGMASSLSLFGDPTPDDVPASNSTKTMGLTDILDEENRKEAIEDKKSDPFSINERYERKEEIARGGMGVVYDAVDTLLQRPVALKLLLGDFGASAQGLQQFLVEARAIAQLSHSNVVMIYDIGIMGKRHYIAMELVKGGSLSGLIKSEKSLSLCESMRIFVEMAKGLRAAHEAGIVHRDIKPANVLLTDKRQVKIVDFGLAKVAPDDEQEDNQTRFRTSGTPGYMAPEQIKGEPLLPRTDIYALGITLFQMIIGQAPHRVKNLKKEFDILSFQVSGQYPSICDLKPEVPEGIDKLYKYCVAQNPEDRYQSIEAFLPTAEGWLRKLEEKESA